PCQVIADLMTVREEFGDLEGLRISWIGDGNNVCNSLLVGCAKFGVDIAVATPQGYEPDSTYVALAKSAAKGFGSRVEVGNSPDQAARDSDVIYTDTWISMGDESQKEQRLSIFPPFQVNQSLLRKAKDSAIVLHCLPAHRGYEITNEIMDGPQSRVFEEAENRLHAQKAILAMIMS
ncbi:MAG: ornithine carbamoyltransferase, partial [Candidatus Hodarchaeota archaeon]